MNEALRGHVTRVGFHLTLSLGQIAALVYIDLAIRAKAPHRAFPVEDRTQPWARALNANFVTGMRGLEARGLIEHHHQDSRGKPKGWNHFGRHYSVTPAGVHVIGLLKEAGIYQEIAPTIVLNRAA